MTLKEHIEEQRKRELYYRTIHFHAFEEEARELEELLQELQLYRTKYDKAADLLIKKCNKIDDCVFYFKKKYVSLTDVCNLIKNKDVLKGDNSE